MKDANDTKTAELPGVPTEPPRRGRPAKYGSAAERQKAYRERLKEQGKREIKRIVRDVREPQPLRSDVIDLSEVRTQKKNPEPFGSGF